MEPPDAAPLLRALGPAADDAGGALVVDGEAISYAGLAGAAAWVAERIHGAGVAAVEARPTLSTVVAVVAGLVAGVPVVPLAPDTGQPERARVVADARAEILLGTGDEDARFDIPSLHVDPARRSGASFPEPHPDATALVMYTSGTTGAPKGVVVSRRAIAADLDALSSAWAWSPDDVLVHGLPLFHVHGLVLGVLGALRVGCHLVHTGAPTAERYAAARGSLYFGVPTVWSRVCEDRGSAAALAGARLLVSGSAALPAPVYDRLTAVTGAPPVERYGMTESLITLSTRAAGERRRGSVGPPLDGVDVRLVDEEDGEVPIGDGGLGEVQVRGPMLFDAYLGQPQATADAFAPGGWLRTGDLATRDPDGFVRIAGRARTDLLKVGGFRIGAGEIEDALLAHAAVREAAVVGRPDDDLGQTIVAHVVAEGVDEQSLITWVSATLAHHKRPRHVVFHPSLPRNAIGKVQKSLLD